MAMFDHGVSKIELTVEFERSRLNGRGSRGSAGLCRLVDDAHLNPKLGEPERQDQAGGTGADDQNVAVPHFVLRSSAALSPVAGVNRPRSSVWVCWPASALQIGRIGLGPAEDLAKQHGHHHGPIS